MLLLTTSAVLAQELNAKVKVNAPKIEGSKQALMTLESELNTFVNDHNWTDLKFAPKERIDCSFTLIIHEMSSPTSYTGELLVQSRRPIFNSSYHSPMLNYRDTKVSFDYIEYQPLSFDTNRYDNNLTSIFAYYIYLILGLDFDSMSLLGGTSYFQTMQSIATTAQSINQAEWGSFNDARVRSSLASYLSNPSYESYRMMWYNYHRKGLDEMASNLDEGRKNIVTSLTELTSLKLRQSNSVLITIFGDAKLDELINVLSNGERDEKKSALETLQSVYPSKSRQLERLK